MFAAAVCVSGAISAQVPAQASPSPDCDWDTWATSSDMTFSGHTASIEWGLQKSGDATFDGQGLPRNHLSGPVIIKGTNEVDFSIHQQEWIINDVSHTPAFTNHYTGTINPDGSASGAWSNDQGGSGIWNMSQTFRCTPNKPAAAAPPPVEKAPPPPVEAPPPPEPPPTDKVVMTIAKSGVFNVKVNITSSAPIPGHCTYNATEINNLGFPANEEFDIAAKGNKTLTLPAPGLGQTYHVVLSCRGDFKGQDVEFGHQEQNFP